MEKYTLDELDYRILNLISNDTRMSFLEVSRICNISGASVHQRVQKMIANQIITGSEFKLDLSRVGYGACAFLKLRCSGDISEAAGRLKEIPEIVECHAAIGDYDLIVKIYAHDNAHLLDIVKQQIRPLGLHCTESLISCGESFRRQMKFRE